MPRIKLIGKGYDKFNGPLGAFEFLEGVSVEDLSKRDADRIGSLVPTVNYESGEEVNAGKSFDEATNSMTVDSVMEASNLQKTTLATSIPEDESTTSEDETSEDEDSEDETSEDEDSEDEAVVMLYTEAELGEIADTEGMDGLRDIAERLDVKGTSFTSIISKILSKQVELKKL
jgi:Ran GTPase-activating protein (RanGAP) involved in mRNA processing and transport